MPPRIVPNTAPEDAREISVNKELIKQAAYAAPGILSNLKELKEHYIPASGESGLGSIVMEELTAAIGGTLIDVAFPITKIASIGWKIRSAVKAAQEKIKTKVYDLFVDISTQVTGMIADQTDRNDHVTTQRLKIISGKIEGAKIDKNASGSEQRAALLEIIRLLQETEPQTELQAVLEEGKAVEKQVAEIETILQAMDDQAAALQKLEPLSKDDEKIAPDEMKIIENALSECGVATEKKKVDTRHENSRQVNIPAATKATSATVRKTLIPIAIPVTAAHGNQDRLSKKDLEKLSNDQELEKEFDRVVDKMSALSDRIWLDNSLTIELSRQLPSQEDEKAVSPTETLYFYYHSDKPEFSVQRIKASAPGTRDTIQYKGMITRGPVGYEPNDRMVISELKEVTDVLDRMLAVNNAEISQLPGHTAHEWRVHRSKERHVDSPDMAARVLVEEALACADPSLFGNIPNLSENRLEGAVLNGTVNTGSRSITFTNVLLDHHHRWVVTDKTSQIPTRPASIEIAEGKRKMIIRNDNNRLKFSIDDDNSGSKPWTPQDYSKNIFEACEDMVGKAAAQHVAMLSRYVEEPSSVDEAQITSLIAKMQSAKARTKTGIYDYSVEHEKEDCIKSAAHILHSLSVNHSGDPRLNSHLASLLEFSANFCGSAQWFSSAGLYYCMEMIQAIDQLVASKTIQEGLLPACRAARTAAAKSAGQAVSADAERRYEYSKDEKEAEKLLPHYRPLLYALDATGVETGARGSVWSTFHNGRNFSKKINTRHLLDYRAEDRWL